MLPCVRPVFAATENIRVSTHDHKLDQQKTNLMMKISNVPEFLKEGLFYLSLDRDDEGEFNVPENCVKKDATVKSMEDLKTLLRTVQFWGLTDFLLEVVEYVLRNGTVADFEDILVEFPVLSKILEVRTAPIFNAVNTAIQLGQGVGVVRKMHQLGYPTTPETCEAAAAAGNLECLMYLHSEGCRWDEHTLIAAVNHNHCDCFKYVVAHGGPTSPELFSYAAYAGSVPMLECLTAHGMTWTEMTLFMAIAGRKLDNMRFLLDAGCPIHPQACLTAARMGDLACLTLLHERGQELVEACAIAAAANGHLPCLIYLRQQHCPWDARCCENAAFGGHLDCLVYLHENGCEWDYTASTAALAGGSWECLWYIIRKGGIFWVPALVLVHLTMLLFAVCAAFVKDRARNDCSTSYAVDVLFIMVPFCNLHTIVFYHFNAYHTEYISTIARDWYMILFAPVVVTVFGYCIYSIYTCTDKA